MKKFDYSIDPATGIHRCTNWGLAGYSLNDAATILYMVLMSYMSYFMVGFVGVAALFVSSFAAMMRLWDGVTDPIVGMLVDRTNNRFGKNRPFIVIGNLILCGTTFIMLYVTPLLPNWAKLPFFIVITLVYYIGYTCQCIITKSALTCMTNDPKQRTVVNLRVSDENSRISR
ncbi:MAG: MFS transporter [Clostridiales bacterium]|jgi:Na+/melibiose symporter-like transporter|nr:MFS transporter [Clostridiales bacterium]